MTDETTKVLLVADFPSDYIRDTIAPSLTQIGIEVTRVVPTDYKGQFGDVAAVLFMFQMTSHSRHDAMKERAKKAGVRFILLERQSSGWVRAFQVAGLDFPGYPIKPAPLPVAPPSKPPALIVANGAPLIPPPSRPRQEAHEVDEPEEPQSGERETTAAGLTFGQALVAARRAGQHSQRDVAAVCDTDQGIVSRWEHDLPIQPAHYAKVLELFPSLSAGPAPRLAKNPGPGKPRTVPIPTAPPAPTPPVAVLVPPMAHAARPLPLDGLRRAARALGITGPIAVIVDDGESKVTAGQFTWPGAGPDEAVESARADLDKRLKEKRAKMEAERIEMEAALDALSAA